MKPVPDAEIVAAYEQAEQELGGPRKADAKAVLRLVSERLGVTYEHARSVMLDRMMPRL